MRNTGYIANRLNMLSGQNLKPLAVLVAWSMQWPEVTKLLLHDTHKMEICDYLAKISRNINDDGNWKMRTSPLVPNEGQEVYISAYEQELADLRNRRLEERIFLSHWSHLPWEEWLHDSDFLACLKCLDSEQLWEQIKTQREGVQPQNQLSMCELMRL